DGSCPRPAGRSGWLTTATSDVSAATARSDGTANAGEPTNTTRTGVTGPPARAPSRQVILIAGAQALVAQHARRLAHHLPDRVELLAQLGRQHRIDLVRLQLARDPIVRAPDLVGARVGRQPEDLEIVAVLDQ